MLKIRKKKNILQKGKKIDLVLIKKKKMCQDISTADLTAYYNVFFKLMSMTYY